MPQVIVIKRSPSAGAVPTPANLVSGELAINTADGKLFAKKDNGTIVTLNGVSELVNLGGAGFAAGEIPMWNGVGWTSGGTIDGGTP